MGKNEDTVGAHPHQSVVLGMYGIIRFRENKIVRFLLDAGTFSMHDLAIMPFSTEDRTQFAQLIGYSVAGFGELPYVSDEAYDEVVNAKGFWQVGDGGSDG